MAVWKYSKPGWMIDIPIVRARRGYTPGSFQSMKVHRPSGKFNDGAFNHIYTIFNLPILVHGRYGQYVQGGYDGSRNTFKKKDGKYKPGNVYGWTDKDVQDTRGTRPYTLHGQFQGKDYPESARADTDPFGNFHFELTITVEGENHKVARFMVCSGLKSACTIFEFEEGGLNARSHKLPGQSKWENLVLRYATSASTFMADWRDKWLQGQFELRKKYSGFISLKNNYGDIVAIYGFTNAWPVSWEGPSLNAGGSELAIETLELAHDGLTIDTELKWKETLE
jgi:phage tail-like protein